MDSTLDISDRLSQDSSSEVSFIHSDGDLAVRITEAVQATSHPAAGEALAIHRSGP